MDKVGVLVKLFLNVIRFLCENGKGAVKILQGILWRFQKGLAVRETAEFAGRGKDPCIDQIRKYGMEIISKPVVVADISADVVQPQFGAELLQEQVTNVKKTPFAQWNTGKRGKGDSNFFPMLVVEQGFFFSFFFLPRPSWQSRHRRTVPEDAFLLIIQSVFFIVQQSAQNSTIENIKFDKK